ncbi:MAG: 3-oxoacyl-ACP reductase [Candidatus Kapaibacterium sp.]|nr:MAG: 3-oxoacyl-ACP reductase [Candidatus Kapabacteria bacterium]
MNISLDGHTALVGGATSGIGWAIAEALARAGAQVILVARSQERLEQRLRALEAQSTKQHYAVMANYDLPEAPQAILSSLTHQNITPDIIINNAGGPAPGRIVDASRGEFHRALDRLILTTHELVHAFFPTMQQKQWGRIINIISTSVRQPIEGLGVSNTIRAATAAWAKTLSIEVAPYGITVNSILPGATLTERLEEIIRRRANEQGIQPDQVAEQMRHEIPMQRFGKPEEIAALAVFLCSDYAGYITGECIRVDGGRTRCL